MRLMFLLLAAGALWPQDSVESRNVLNQGVTAFRNARYAEAVEMFQHAVDLDPSSATARLYLATAHMQQYIPGADSPENAQMAARAKGEFVKVLDLDPGNTVALSSIAALHLNQKEWREAREWYQRLIAVSPSNADAYYTLGYIAWSEWYPAYGQARVRVGMSIDTPGPIPDPTVRQDLKDRFGTMLEDGLANLREALEINPQYEDAMSYMNLLTRERADLRDTKADYRSDIAEADQWMQKALETKRQKAQQSQATAAGVLPQRIRVGGAVQESKLIRRVDPVYPALAQQARIQGVVLLNLIISKEGAVSNVAVLTGHPLLVPAAIEAAKRWVYQPTLLNGNPVEVQTEVSIPFSFDRAVSVK